MNNPDRGGSLSAEAGRATVRQAETSYPGQS